MEVATRKRMILLSHVFALTMLSVSAARRPVSQVLNERDGAVLTGSESRAVLHQCSHYGPVEASSTWQPLQSQVLELESRLPSFIKQQKDRPPGELTEYLRQYVGVVIGGHKFIYINGFPKSEIASDIEAFESFRREHPEVLLTSTDFPDSMRTLDGWRHSAVVVCDGGSAYWGALYDPATRRFSAYSANGVG